MSTLEKIVFWIIGVCIASLLLCMTSIVLAVTFYLLKHLIRG